MEDEWMEDDWMEDESISNVWVIEWSNEWMEDDWVIAWMGGGWIGDLHAIY